MKDFFVSYNRADQRWAEWVAWHLEEAGYTVVVQAWDFRPGSNFVMQMNSAAREAERTVAIVSQAYVQALFTHPEWAAAFARDPTGEKGTLVPVRVEECELEGLLAQVVYVDLVGLDESACRQRLVAGVERGRAKPPSAPRYPGDGSRAVAEQPHFPLRQRPRRTGMWRWLAAGVVMAALLIGLGSMLNGVKPKPGPVAPPKEQRPAEQDKPASKLPPQQRLKPLLVNFRGSVTPAADVDDLRVVVVGKGQSRVGPAGEFRMAIEGENGERVRVQVHRGGQILYDDYQTLPGPVELPLRAR